MTGHTQNSMICTRSPTQPPKSQPSGSAIRAPRGLESVTVRNKGWSAAALLALHDEVIAPILAGIRSPRRGRKPAHWTRIDRDYETLRIGMQSLFDDLGITPTAAAAA